MSGSLGVAAVVVTFHPDECVDERLAKIRREVGRMVIVDNGSPADIRQTLETWAVVNRATVVANTENRGLAAALNQGMAWCEAEGYEWIVTFDQDSTPEPGFVQALVATAESFADPARVAVVGAHTFDEQTGREDRWLRSTWFGFRRVYCEGSDLSGVTFVITSGSLTRIRAWRGLGGFDEGLFIDYLDHDLCLKARRSGWDICVSAKDRLAHNLGSKREVVVAGRTIRPTFHSAVRHYYMMRNRILMWKRYGWRYPHWWLFDLVFGTMNTVRVMLAEDARERKLFAMLFGLWDGLCGRRGPMPENRSSRLSGVRHDQ